MALAGLACCSSTTVGPEPPAPRASASVVAVASAPAVASGQGARAAPSASADDLAINPEDPDEIIYPRSASPPEASITPAPGSLEASREQFVELVARFARRRGKAPVVDEIRQAFSPAPRPADPAAPAPPSRWGRLCRQFELIKEEPIDQLCKNGGDWLPSVLVADFDGDGTDDFILFGTWSVAAHQDDLLGVYVRDGEAVRPLPLPQSRPFAPDETLHHFGRPFLKKVEGGLLLEDSIYERWDAAGGAIGHSPLEEAARTRTETHYYLIARGVPRLQKTRIEDWDKARGRREKTVKAKP